MRSGRLWPERADGFVLPDAAWADAASPAERAALALDELQGAWWDPAWPVMAISWEDAMAYAGWRRAAGAWCFTLADEVQWEWAARGGDGRPYPWGEVADGAFYNGSRSQHPLALPAPPGRFVYDESGAGIRGLGGNMSEWCLNEPPGGEAGWRVWRGGNWNYSPVFARSTTRAWEPPGGVQPHVGVRLAAVPQLCGPPS